MAFHEMGKIMAREWYGRRGTGLGKKVNCKVLDISNFPLSFELFTSLSLLSPSIINL